MKCIIPGIYKITNIINEKAYIGKSENVSTRWYLHVRTAKQIRDGKKPRGAGPVHYAMVKYGIENFRFEIIQFFIHGVPSETALNSFEIFYIADQNTFLGDPNGWGYNRTKGGEGIAGYSPSPESRKKMGESHKGMFEGDKNPFYGKHHKPETIERIRADKLGRYFFSPEKREAMTRWLRLNPPFKGRTHKESFLRQRSKPVLCIETGRFYMSIGIAARDTGINTACLYVSVTKGTITHKNHWKYISWDEYDNLKEKYPEWHVSPKYCGPRKPKGDRDKCHPICCIELDRVFRSSAHAVRELNLPVQHGCLINAAKRQHKSSGYHWRLISWEEYDKYSVPIVIKE